MSLRRRDALCFKGSMFSRDNIIRLENNKRHKGKFRTLFNFMGPFAVSCFQRLKHREEGCSRSLRVEFTHVYLVAWISGSPTRTLLGKDVNSSVQAQDSFQAALLTPCDGHVQRDLPDRIARYCTRSPGEGAPSYGDVTYCHSKDED
ncbi:hypothetical protein EDB87DRAFT_1581095 [Lactarius vividus]|nr:hypothetical protein EDB87DRAFT_1581095 [Lactarius vividus]